MDKSRDRRHHDETRQPVNVAVRDGRPHVVVDDQGRHVVLHGPTANYEVFFCGNQFVDRPRFRQPRLVSISAAQSAQSIS